MQREYSRFTKIDGISKPLIERQTRSLVSKIISFVESAQSRDLCNWFSLFGPEFCWIFREKEMNHSDRSFSYKEIGSEDDLVKAMTEHKWPLCYSLLFGKLLYINDGNSEDDRNMWLWPLKIRAGITRFTAER